MCFTICKCRLLSNNIQIMPPIRNSRVQRRFSPYQRKVIGVCFLLILNSLHREYWVHPFSQDVHEKGEFFTTYPDLRKYPYKFFRTYRMSVRQFDALLHLLRPAIEKQNNKFSGNYLCRRATCNSTEVRSKHRSKFKPLLTNKENCKNDVAKSFT